MNVLDYSQYSLWNFCPWAWYERYVNQMGTQYIGQRNDPLCLGSLVHNGLDNFAKHGRPFIDDATIRENEPTPDTANLAELLVQGYIRKYPSEQWPVEATEQPLLFPLASDFTGMAKLDGYFYVPEDTTIASGIGDHTLTLSCGWWAKEYKTKAASRRRAEWIKEWQTKRQADFQMLALNEYLHRTRGQEIELAHYDNNVQGVLVCVLEKPREYTPMRKCAGCKDSYELAAYVPKSDGYLCPACGVLQQLSPYVPKVPKIPDYFRITVTRTPEQLDTARYEITQTAHKMQMMRDHGMECFVPNRDACVNNVHRRECEYLAPHTYGGTTFDNPTFVKINATGYMGLENIA